MSRPIVLLIEDNDDWAESAKLAFADKVQVLRASDIVEARSFFKEYGHKIDGIYFDACIEGKNGAENVYTFDFVTEVREAGFDGPMVTASCNVEFNEMLYAAGCNYRSTKRDAPALLLTEIGVE